MLMNDLQKICVVTAKVIVINGIVVTKYNDLIVIKCVDYVQKENIEGYKKPLQRTAEQRKSLMGFTQNY